MTMIAPSITVNDRPYRSPRIDYAGLARRLWCLPGCAIFATPSHIAVDERDSGLILPTRWTERQRLPVATCVQADPAIGIVPGDVCIVHQGFAKRVSSVRIGSWTLPRGDGELWLFGCASPRKGDCYRLRPDNWLYAHLDHHETAAELQGEVCPFIPYDLDVDLRAVDCTRYYRGSLEQHGQVALALPTAQKTRNGLALIDKYQEWPDMGITLAASPGCKHVEPGLLAWYQRAALHGWGSLPHLQFASVHEQAIFAFVDAS